MERHHLDDARAFAFLTRLSLHETMKLREIAQRIVTENKKATRRRRGDDRHGCWAAGPVPLLLSSVERNFPDVVAKLAEDPREEA